MQHNLLLFQQFSSPSLRQFNKIISITSFNKIHKVIELNDIDDIHTASEEEQTQSNHYQPQYHLMLSHSQSFGSEKFILFSPQTPEPPNEENN